MELPATQNIISLVESMTLAQKQPKITSAGLHFEWAPGVPIADLIDNGAHTGTKGDGTVMGDNNDDGQHAPQEFEDFPEAKAVYHNNLEDPNHADDVPKEANSEEDNLILPAVSKDVDVLNNSDNPKIVVLTSHPLHLLLTLMMQLTTITLLTKCH